MSNLTVSQLTFLIIFPPHKSQLQYAFDRFRISIIRMLMNMRFSSFLESNMIFCDSFSKIKAYKRWLYNTPDFIADKGKNLPEIIL